MLKKIVSKIDLDFRNLLSKSFSTSVVKLAGKISGLILSIFLARTLGPALLGTINLSNQIIGLLLVITMLGMRIILIKNISILKSKKLFKEINKLVNTAYFINGGLGLIVTLLILYFSNFIGTYFFNEENLKIALSVMSIAVVPQILTRIHSYALLGLNKVWQSSIAEDTLSALFTLIVLVLLKVSGFQMNIKNICLAFVFSRILLSFLMFFYWSKQIKNNIKIKNLSFGIFKKSFPFFAISIIGVLQARFDIFVIGYYLTPTDIGVYTVAVTLAMIPNFFFPILESAASPKIAYFHAEKKIRQLSNIVQKTSILLFVIGVLVFLFYIFFGAYLLSIWGNEFIVAKNILIIISIGQLFNMLSGPSAMVLVMSGLENLRKNLAFITFMLNILFSIIFIKHYGLLGAAVSSALISLIVNISLIIMVRIKLKFWPIKFYNI